MSGTNTPAGEKAGRPNIVLILADDMGFSDIGCYGSQIATPNLDRLAREGIRFTQMYNCARCCPTRASLLTGVYPHQAGIGHMVANRGTPAYQGYLRDDRPTLAEMLSAGGYQTFMSGKWHVGGGYQANKPGTWRPGAPDHPIPTQRGFQAYYGMLGGAGSYFHPPYMLRDAELITPEPEGYYITDAITDNAVAMIRRATKKPDPFFLYVAYTAPHWPLHARPEDIAKYEGKYRDGWDAHRTARHEQLKAMGIIDAKWAISPRDEAAPPWEQLDAERRDWEDLRMAVYAAQIDRMDQGIGRILRALRQAGQEDNTMVIFLSDNGGCAEFLAEDTGKPEPFRYNIPTPDGRAVRIGNLPGLRPGPDDTFMSYDLPWANTSNSPFRRFKRWVHEGGISTPMIVHWPGRVAGGALCHSPAHVMDITVTCLDAAGIPPLAELNGKATIPLEGESFLTALSGRNWSREAPIFWEHEGNRAVRAGNWKLVAERSGPWELYEMNEDRTELNDLVEVNPGKAKELEALYEAWARRCGVVDWKRLAPGK